MRATRAYLAGLGTAGTLVLAASILFVLGSAIVTYNGWPKLGGIGSPATQTLTAHPKSGSHASHGLASVTVVKPHPGRPASGPAAGANKRSTLLAQTGSGSVAPVAAHHSTSGTISRPVAGQRPTHRSAPTKTGSGSGSTGSGGGTTTVTTPTTPVATTPTPIASTPTTPVSTGSDSGSSGSGSGSSGSGSSGSGSGSSGSGSGSGSSGSGGGSGSSNPVGTVTTVIKPGSGTVTSPISVGTHPTGTPVISGTGVSGSSAPTSRVTTTPGSTTSTTSTTTTTTPTSSSSSSTGPRVSVTAPVSRTGVSVGGSATAHAVTGVGSSHYGSPYGDNPYGADGSRYGSPYGASGYGRSCPRGH